MKKILIFSHAMEIGGAERALLGFLETIDTSKYEVDLFLMRHEGELMKYIPEQIHLLPEIPQYACLAIPMTRALKKGQFGMVFGRLAAKVAAARRRDQINLSGENEIELEYSHKYTVPFVPRINDDCYDVAVSFLTPHYFVANKVKAKKKIAWIHTDYSFVQVDQESQRKMWDAYDFIASISEDVSNSFVSLFPELKEKVVLLPNIIPEKMIRQMAQMQLVHEEMPDDGSIRLLSIGRFCTAKNFDSVPELCRKLREKGLNVKWYLAGYGNDELLIRSAIQREKMESFVVILGKKENPYPYIRNCDFYVQPSRFEGKCVSVIEAQILSKPVIIANYVTAKSQLRDGVDGVIVPQEIQRCADGIAEVIGNAELQRKIVRGTHSTDYSNAFMMEQFYELMGLKE